jgi:FMN phosphatase YigB (HAD superfamily)
LSRWKSTSIRAIVFDLDDTLFDCHGQLVMEAHREAASAMVRAGLPCDPEEAFRARMEIFRSCPRGDVDRLLAERYGVSGEAVSQAGFEAFHRRHVGAIVPFPDVPEALRRLRESYRLFLLTGGDRETQQMKIDRLGIRWAFEDVLFCGVGSGEKGKVLRRLLEHTGLRPREVLSVGNRIDREIREAKELGMATALMVGGEYGHLRPEGALENPDMTIGKVSDLLGYLCGR